MAPAHTLPDKHVWLADAFERAWVTLEDSEKYQRALEDDIVSDENGWVSSSDDAKLAYNASRRRVEKLLRSALKSGLVRALIRDVVTGETAELAERSKWSLESFGSPGLRTYVHHLVCPGPETNGAPVFVRSDELERFIRGQLPEKAAAPKSRAATISDIEALKHAHDGVCPPIRESQSWRKKHRPNVSHDSFYTLWQSHTMSLKRGRNNRS